MNSLSICYKNSSANAMSSGGCGHFLDFGIFTDMRRRHIVFFLLLAMLWQSIAMAHIGSTVNVMVDLEHAALHLQEESHHHHEDGSYHQDDSSLSAQHKVMDHHQCASLEMGVPLSHDFPPLGSADPGGLHETLLPNPTPDGLLRPPRALA